MIEQSLPTGWRWATVGDIAAPTSRPIVSGPFGSNIGKRFFVPEGIPVIRGNNLTKDLTRFVDDGFVYLTPEKAAEFRNCEALPGDLVFTAAGSLGQVGLIPQNSRFPRYIISNKQLRARVDSQLVNPVFAFYWLSSPWMVKHIEQRNTGSSIPLINLSILRSLPVPLPPLPTQRKIAAILSAYDELIENNTRRIALLEEMAHALYREWFVEFRYPGHEGVPLVESSLGPIPQGWEVVKLGDVVELAYGKALRSEERLEGDVPVYGSSGIVGFHDIPLVDGPGIIVGRKGNVGSVYWTDEAFYPIDTVYFVRSELPLPYLYFNMQGQRFINNDAAVPGLNRNQAYSLPLLIPTPETLGAFVTFVIPVFAQLKAVGKATGNLRRTRDLLLPKLVSGEVDVEGPEIEVSDG